MNHILDKLKLDSVVDADKMRSSDHVGVSNKISRTGFKLLEVEQSAVVISIADGKDGIAEITEDTGA
jgi:hypothetical protein